MALDYDKLNIREKEDYKFRNTGATDNKQTKVGVEVENDATNPIPVYITDSTADTKINEFANVSAVATSVLTTVVTYTVPAGKTFFLDEVECGGENIARYDVLLDAVLIARKRTWFSGGLNLSFRFSKFEISAASVVSVKVVHDRPLTGDFESRIIGTII
jgi:hypothetical protein